MKPNTPASSMFQKATATKHISGQRKLFTHGARVLVMAVSESEAVFRAWITQRAAAGNDPSDAGIMMVLEHQLQTRQALTDAERVVAVEMDSDTGTPEAYCRNVIAALAAMQATQESV